MELTLCGHFKPRDNESGRNGSKPHTGGAERLCCRTMLILVLLGVALSACASTQSRERASDGSTVYLDQLSDTAKAQERQEIAQRLRQDVVLFHIGIGDELKVFFDIDPKPTHRVYLISVRDKLHVEFLNDPKHSGTVTVRPDGRISLPAIGSMMAAGRTADKLARQIQQRYARFLNRRSFLQRRPISAPRITVNVIQSHSPMDRFVAMLSRSQSSLSVTTKVLPDGTISLPLLVPIEARGRTLEQLGNEIDAAYSAVGLSIAVGLVPQVLRPGSIMISGEVGKPGRIPLDRPHTVLMAVAEAGGVLPTGSMKSVRVFYFASDGTPHTRVVNLNKEVEDLKVEDDMIVPDNSIIYVPPNELTKIARFTGVIGEIIHFNGFNFNGDYLFNQPSVTTFSSVVGK